MLLSYTCCTFLVTACLCLHSLLAPAQTLLKDIFSGPAGSTPTSYTTLNGILYFIADDGTHGRELWKSDGTAGGTQLVKDINPGPKSSDIREMTVCNGLLFFSAFSKDGISAPARYGVLMGQPPVRFRRTMAIKMVRCKAPLT